MSALPERTVDAILVARFGYAQEWPGRRAALQRDFAAASDPALGPDRLVVAGPFETQVAAETIEMVCAWLETRNSEYFNSLAVEIEAHFSPSPERTT